LHAQELITSKWSCSNGIFHHSIRDETAIDYCCAFCIVSIGILNLLTNKKDRYLRDNSSFTGSGGNRRKNIEAALPKIKDDNFVDILVKPKMRRA